MNEEHEALKLALEALESTGLFLHHLWCDVSMNDYSLDKLNKQMEVVDAQITAIREALADSALDRMAENARELGLDYEPDVVLPGGGHVPAVPVAVYGYCPECGGAGVMRERRPNGDDKCTNGHKYPSAKALAEPPCKTGSQCTNKCPQCDEPAQQDMPKIGCVNHDCDKCKTQQQEPVAVAAWNLARMTRLLFDAWCKAEPTHNITKYPESYMASFQDMARAVIQTSPPASKPWVGLTLEQRATIAEANNMLVDNDLFDEIEAKLRGKNAQPSKPLTLWTEAQHERAYRNSPELHKDVKSLAAFKRVAKKIAAMYGIKGDA